MKALLLLSFVVYANAQLADLGKGLLIHLGPFNTTYQVGNLTKRYQPLTNDDVEAGDNAEKLLEDLRRLFGVGFNRLPPLDPYTRSSLPPLSLDNYLELIKGTAHLNNLVVSGAKHFQQNVLELRLRTGRLDFAFAVPSINFNVDLALDALLADYLPLHLKGDLSLLLSGVKVVGSAHVVPAQIGAHQYYQVVALYYHLHVEDVGLQLKSDVDIDKILKDSVLIGIIDALPKDFFNKIIHNLNAYATDVILQEANSMLLIATSTQVLAYLLPDTY